MAAARKPMKKKQPDDKQTDINNVFDFVISDEKKENMSGSEDDIILEDDTETGPSIKKKRIGGEYEQQQGIEVQSMLERFGADISKAMQAKRKRLESLTKNYMKGSQQKLETLWKHHHTQRQKLTDQYAQQVSSALQQWETEAQRTEEQEEKLNNLFRQQQKIIQQARVVQNQKLKTVKELYEQFVTNMGDMEKSHDAFLQGAQQELRKEMASLQKKILMDTQQQEMATVRKSLQSMLF